MSLDILNVEPYHLDFDIAPFEGVPSFSEALDLEGVGTDLPYTFPVTSTDVLKAGEQTAYPEPRSAHPPTQRRLLYWDFEHDRFIPVPSHLVFRPCSPPPLEEMGELPMAPAARHGNGGFLPPGSEGTQRLRQNPPVSTAPAESSAANAGKKRKMRSDDDLFGDGVEGDDDVDEQLPRPAPKQQRMQPQMQSRNQNTCERPAREDDASSSVAARQDFTALRDQRKYWRQRELKALAEAEEWREKQVKALRRADYYRSRRCEKNG